MNNTEKSYLQEAFELVESHINMSELRCFTRAKLDVIMVDA